MKAAILETLNAPLAVCDVDMATHRDNKGGLLLLDHGQVFVRVLVAGICGAQLQEIAGHKGDPAHLPHLLGHEGCGIVEAIGLGVTHVKKGDKVVLHWRKGAGADIAGATYQRSEIRDQKSDIRNQTSVFKSGPITTFSEYTIVSENRLTPIPEDLPDDLACLLGCSLSTALGVIENEARVKMGESVMIVGCGGLGLALILAARLAHAVPIIGVDINPRKSMLIESLGAMFMIDGSPEMFFDGKFEVIIDTTGTVPHLNMLAPSGRYIMVGQPNTSSYLTLTSHFFSGQGQRIQATQGGCFSPSTDIPRYVNLWRSGALNDYNKLITHRVTLDRINDGFDLLRDRKAGRVLVDINKESRKAGKRDSEFPGQEGSSFPDSILSLP